MKFAKLIASIFCFIMVSTLRGQNIEKANVYYKDGYYAKAIPIYEASLKKKSSVVVKSKLANSYRILNQADKASVIYREIISDDKAEPVDFFRYGEVLMMLSHYDSAKVYFEHFNSISPEDERGAMMLKAIDKMKDIVPAMINVIIEPFKQNTDADENVPVFYKNGVAFATDRESGFKMFKEKNKTTGREYFTIFYSEKLGDTAFAQPKELSSSLSEVNKNTGNISFTKDMKYAFFCRNSSTSSKNGTYNMQLYSGEANKKGGWKKVKLISFCNNENNYMYPSVSPDGKQLFFVADRGDGIGGLDIYVSKKTKKGWGKPENLGDKINTPMHEGFPYFSEQGKLYFCSKGHEGYGGFDIFVTSRDSITGEWLKPQNLGTPINSAYDDISISFADSTWGAFTSNRSGRGDDVFFFKIKNQSLISPTDTLATSALTADKVSGFTFDIESSNPYVEITKPSETYLNKIYQGLESGALRVNSKYIVENILFDTTDTTKLTSEMKAELDKLAVFMTEYRKVIVEIGAHTEGVGDRKILKAHSQKLAEAMVQYLIDNGVKSKQLMAKGYGSVRPLKDCREGGCTADEDLQNRRIELKILKL
jgi:peptidoglycan-associated lipoprotein